LLLLFYPFLIALSTYATRCRKDSKMDEVAKVGSSDTQPLTEEAEPIANGTQYVGNAACKCRACALRLFCKKLQPPPK